MALPAFLAIGQPSTGGKRFDFESVAGSRAIRACWFLKCIKRPSDLANHITSSSVGFGRCGLEVYKWLPWQRI
jgi:hypothetical protein